MSKYHQIEVVNQADTFEAIVDRNFRGKTCHRAEEVAAFDVERMAVEMSEVLLRSWRDYIVTPSGLAKVPVFTDLLFRLEDDLFVHVAHKPNSYSPDRTVRHYRVLVTSSTPARALEGLEKMRKTYRQSREQSGPGFFVVTGAGQYHHAPLEEKYLLPDEILDLHYGDNFSAWTKEFLAGLGETGISIFRGDVGTGKTSFLRHVMSALAATHRFYFVPVDHVGILSSGGLTEFWKREHRDFPSATKVLVLEDAEALLASRGSKDHSAVSTILNLTDGLMSQLVRVHLLCTLNCSVESLDKAVIRPGRLRFFREFERLPRARAQQIAQHYGLTLPDEKDYSLAEIFSAAEPATHLSGLRKPARRVGFGG